MLNDIDLGEVVDKDWKCATFKQVIDLTEKTDALIAKCGVAHADSFKNSPDKLDAAIEEMMDLEKKARLGGDAKSNLRLALEIINLLVALGDHEKLMFNAELLMKRRAQPKSVQTAILKSSRSAIEKCNEADKVTLIKKLRDICQGKIHVELEFAQLSVELVNIWEKQGLIKESAELLQEVQVETISNMERLEKLTILLHQMRLNLDVEDYIRAAIMARKTTSRALSKPNSRLIKIEYYQLMLRYYAHFRNYWYLAKCWMELYATVTDEEVVKEIPDHPLVKDPTQALRTCCVFLVLSPNAITDDREQTDAAAFSTWNKETDRLALIEKYSKEKLAQDHLPQVVEFAGEFLQKELIHWPIFQKKYENVCPDVLSDPKIVEDLHTRVTEHNIKVISRHYKRIKVTRLAELIDLSVTDAEDAVCKLVIVKDIWAKVDRIDGIITFQKKKNHTEVMNDMKTGIDHVLSQITSTCHLLHKEKMLHGITA
eukprot:TRINITY_DN3116_c1_g1_i4.p1 TRINITY_DN3116_c1_g1~~TRINITY_DN3116_c1_g1_i4.p1  ORF type:complete len:485 (+),score=87.30 TRINITY_DN3116_c1_g1_i4:70-1524(+)